MGIYVISGGPGTGKTSVINELKKQKFKIIKEGAREVSETNPKFIGKSVKQINQKEFQEEIFNYLIDKFNEVDNSKIVFSDRGFGDSLAYYKIHNLKANPNFLEIAKKLRYSKIFILEPLDIYVRDSLRTETKQEALEIHKKIIKEYEDLGYNIIFVPVMSVKERAEFIKSKI